MSTILSTPEEKISPEHDHTSLHTDEFTLSATDKLRAAAMAVRMGGQRGSKAVEDLAEGAAQKLDGAGAYFDRHDLTEAAGQSKRLVRRYPGESLAIAAGVGFLTAFALRRLMQSGERSAAS